MSMCMIVYVSDYAGGIVWLYKCIRLCIGTGNHVWVYVSTIMCVWLCVCICTCDYIYSICICLCIWLYVYVDLGMWLCMWLYMWLHVFYMCVCVCDYMHVLDCTYLCVCICTHTVLGWEKETYIPCHIMHSLCTWACSFWLWEFLLIFLKPSPYSKVWCPLVVQEMMKKPLLAT